MTKKLFSLATVGILLLIIGVAGGAAYYVKADKQISQTVKESYQPKSKQATEELHLVLSGNMGYRINQSEDNRFHLKGKTFSLYGDQKVQWKKSEDDKKTKMTVQFKKGSRKLPEIGINFWENDNQALYLSIPKSYKKITIETIKNSQVTMFDTITDDLTLTNNHSNIYLNNSKFKTITATGDGNYTSVSHTIIEHDANFSSETGPVELSDVTATNITLKTNSGPIEANELKGNITLESVHGEINATNLKGDTRLKTTNGGINWYQDTVTHDTDITSTNGNIWVNFEKRPKTTTIKADSKNGTVSMFDKEKNTYKGKQDKHQITLKTTSGDIQTVAYSYDDEFDDDID